MSKLVGMMAGMLSVGGPCRPAGSGPGEAPRGPLPLAGVTLDGVYTSFHRVFLQRMKLMHKPVFPVLGEIEHYIKKNTGVDIQKQSPYHALPNVQVPTLFLQSRADVSSLPQYTPALFERCGSTKKQLE